MSSSIPTSIHYSSNSNPFLERAYSLNSDPTAARTLYDEWATTYDGDLSAESYRSPTAAADALARHLSPANGTPPKKLKVLDAGCGTGLVGLAIHANGELRGRVGEIDGLDLSEGMLAVARKTGVYARLETADLTQRIAREDGEMDVVVCVGTLTKGHVGPGVLGEFVRVVNKGDGLVVATVLEDVWVSGGFEGEVERLRKDGGLEVVAVEDFGIVKAEKKGGKMLVLRRGG
jgi:predicted TPR repeat methyltransferase